MTARTKKTTQIGPIAPFYEETGIQKGTINLPKDTFGQKPNKVLLAQAVRVYRANQRKSRAHTKGRGEVKASTRKIYRQKGTGGARHGALSAPIFVGGGVAHGPKKFENYHLALPKKMAQKAFLSALSVRLADKNVTVADIEKIEPKTKTLAQFLKKLEAKTATIVHSGSQSLVKAGRNIPNISLINSNTLNTYDILISKHLILTKESLDVLAKRARSKISHSAPRAQGIQQAESPF